MIFNTEIDTSPPHRRGYRLRKKTTNKRQNSKSQFSKVINNNNNMYDGMDLLESDLSYLKEEDIKESVIANFDSDDEFIRIQSEPELQVRSFTEIKNPFSSFMTSTPHYGTPNQA